MATEQTVIIKGALEDDQGRIIHPDTEADQVVHSDGKTLEQKLSELVTVSESMTASLAASATKVTVDVSAFVTPTGLTNHVYHIDVLTSTAEAEVPVATVYSQLIGSTAVFYRGGVNAGKSIAITFRVVAIKLS